MSTEVPNYNVEAGRLLEFLGRIAVRTRADAGVVRQDSGSREEDRNQAAFDIYTFADLTENVQSMGKAMAEDLHVRVAADAELMLTMFSENLALHTASDDGRPHSFRVMMLQPGIEIFTAITEKARYLLALASTTA